MSKKLDASSSCHLSIYLSLDETMTLALNYFFFLKLGQFDTAFLVISFTKNVYMPLTSVLLTHF